MFPTSMCGGAAALASNLGMDRTVYSLVKYGSTVNRVFRVATSGDCG